MRAEEFSLFQYVVLYQDPQNRGLLPFLVLHTHLCPFFNHKITTPTRKKKSVPTCKTKLYGKLTKADNKPEVSNSLPLPL